MENSSSNKRNGPYIIIFLTIIIILFILQLFYSYKLSMPEQEVAKEVVKDVAEQVVADSIEVALIYTDGRYIVDKNHKQWHLDIT